MTLIDTIFFQHMVQTGMTTPYPAFTHQVSPFESWFLWHLGTLSCLYCKNKSGALRNQEIPLKLVSQDSGKALPFQIISFWNLLTHNIFRMGPMLHQYLKFSKNTKVEKYVLHAYLTASSAFRYKVQFISVNQSFNDKLVENMTNTVLLS
jgi:hypothetical protein